MKLTNATSDMSITPAGCIDQIFRRLDIYQGSNVLEQIDQYGNLCNVLLDSQVSPVDRAYQRSLCNSQVSPAAAKSVYFTTTLLSGVIFRYSCEMGIFHFN